MKGDNAVPPEVNQTALPAARFRKIGRFSVLFHNRFVPFDNECVVHEHCNQQCYDTA